MSKTNKKGFDVPKGFPIPLNKSVILARIKTEMKTSSGLFLNEGAEENNVAVIMAVGDNCDPRLQPGAKVMYNIREDREIRFEDTRYLIMHETALLCVLPENAILMPQSLPNKVKKTREFQHEEKIRQAAMARKEENDFDKIQQTARKKFNKKK